MNRKPPVIYMKTERGKVQVRQACGREARGEDEDDIAQVLRFRARRRRCRGKEGGHLPFCVHPQGLRQRARGARMICHLSEAYVTAVIKAL